MKRIGRFFIAFFSNLFSSVISTLMVVLFSRPFAFRKIKNKSSKATCWVLANGPSLNNDIKNIDLEARNRLDLLVVNEFCFSENFEVLKPERYIIIDPAYWTENQQAVESLVKRFYESLNGKVNWPLQLFVPFSGYSKVKKRISNSYIQVMPFNNTPVNGFSSFEILLYNYNLGVTQLQNVVVGAIYLGVLMNYKTINLVGVDHDWHKNIHVDRNNYVVWQNKHFYDATGTEEKYERIYSGSGYFDMQQIFKALSLTYSSYKKLATYARHRGININNYTKGSCIDAFDRK